MNDLVLCRGRPPAACAKDPVVFRLRKGERLLPGVGRMACWWATATSISAALLTGMASPSRAW
eukprot:9097431-Heterocapsa_arctica.AAC.1